jgi:hypothetical protein
MSLFPIRIWTLNHVIAPHGITDIVHAQVHRRFPALLTVYGGSAGAGWLLHTTQQDCVLYGLFGLLSVVHFRNDFVFPKWTAALTTLALVVQPSPFDAVILYMLALHVPNHYRMAWPYICKQKYLTFALLFGTGVWCDSFLLSYMFNQPFFIVSIIMGHVVYQECFVREDQASAN